MLPAYLDAEIANLREGVRLGYTAPRTNVAAVIEQIDAMLLAPLGDSPFVQMAQQAGALRDTLEIVERHEIRPAMTRYRDYLRDEYLETAREAVGVSANPNGEACIPPRSRSAMPTALPPHTRCPPACDRSPDRHWRRPTP